MTLACRDARQTGATNVLSEITGRQGFVTVGHPVPEDSHTTNGLAATIFLNKAWEVEREGGELRISPTSSTLATIPPVFDRVVFYPPHLVSPVILPASRDSVSCSLQYK